LNKKNTGVQEFRSSGVQEFRRILNKRTCLEIGVTSQAYFWVRIPISRRASELLHSELLSTFSYSLPGRKIR
jgi:hypothetical protein